MQKSFSRCFKTKFNNFKNKTYLFSVINIINFLDEITLYKQTKGEETVNGIVKLEIQYDSNKHFEGQVISNADLDLRG